MLEALTRAQNAINSALDLDTLLETILRTVRDVFNLKACAVILMEDDHRTLRIRAAVGYDEQIVQHWRGTCGEGISGKVAADGKPSLLCDVHKDKRYVRGVKDAICEMTAPLVFDNHILGVLDAESDRVLTKEDLRYFELFAGQAAVAIRNATLHTRSEKTARELAMVASVGARLNNAGDLDSLLDFILEAGNQALGYDRCAVLLIEGTELHVKASIGHDLAAVGKLRIPLGTGITGSVALSRQSILLVDVKSDPRFIAASGDACSEMSQPLLFDGQLLGVLDAESVTQHFSDDDFQVFKAFADQASAALHGAELVQELQDKNSLLAKQLDDISSINQELHLASEELQTLNLALQKRLQELSTLYEAGKAITASLDLDETLHAILSMTERLMDISNGAIVLLDEETAEIKVRISIDRKNPHTVIPSELTYTVDEHSINIPLLIGNRLIGRFELRHNNSVSFSKDEQAMLQSLASQAAIAIENARLYENTQKAYYQAIRSLAEALEARDAYTRGHSERVTEYSLQLADRLGLAAKEKDIIRYAGLLHDIGKIGVADAVLLKVGHLTEEDFSVIRHHPQFGDAILSPLHFLAESQLIVRHHHEKWDGTGYPDKLKQEAIPLAARIIAIADSFDAMTSDRPYRQAMHFSAALAEISAGAGTQFDPTLAALFVQLKTGHSLTEQLRA